MASNNDLLRPINTGRASDQIADRIRSAIRLGTLAVGDRLPSERELVSSLGVSRVTVRDALRILEAQGLFEIRVGAKGGAYVQAPLPELIAQGLNDMVSMASLDPQEVTEVRQILELGIIQLACDRATKADIEELLAICDRADSAVATGEYDLTLSLEFHARLNEATHNDAFQLLLEVFQEAVASSLRMAQSAQSPTGRQGASEHREIVNCIAAGDIEGARAVMSRHLDRTAIRLRQASAGSPE